MKVIFPFKNPGGIFQDLNNPHATWEYRLATIAVFTQLIIGAAALLWYWRFLPPKIPLWYSRPWGEERLTSPFFLLLPLFNSLVVYGLNQIIIVTSVHEHPMFVRVLYLTSLLISILGAIIVIRIVTLVS